MIRTLNIAFVLVALGLAVHVCNRDIQTTPGHSTIEEYRP